MRGVPREKRTSEYRNDEIDLQECDSVIGAVSEAVSEAVAETVAEALSAS